MFWLDILILESYQFCFQKKKMSGTLFGYYLGCCIINFRDFTVHHGDEPFFPQSSMQNLLVC